MQRSHSRHTQEHNCELEEWKFPTTTLWAEHKHLGSDGPGYTSKMTAFQEIVDRAKLGSLNLSASTAGATPTSSAPSSQTQVPLQRAVRSGVVDLCGDEPPTQAQRAGASTSRRVRLLADFPHVSGPEACEQLRDLLVMLAQSVRTPIIVLITEAGALRACAPLFLRAFTSYCFSNRSA